MSKEMTGGCACGAIRYRTSQGPGFEFHCYCRQCQRATGTGHASAMIFANANVDLTGELSFYTQSADSGNQVHRGFCGNCGSPVLNRNDGYPDNLYVHAATLDSPSDFKPSASVCGEFAQSWDQPTGDQPTGDQPTGDQPVGDQPAGE